MNERLEITKIKKKTFIIEYLVIILAIWLSFEFITYLIEPTLMALCKVRAESLRYINIKQSGTRSNGRDRIFRFNNIR